MKVIPTFAGYSLEASRDELGIISNCINDAMDLMSPADFLARVGVSEEEAYRLLKQIGAVLSQK